MAEDRRKLLYENAQYPVKIFEKGIEGFYSYGFGGFLQKTIYEFRSIDDFNAIYRWEWKIKFLDTNFGYQLETKGKEVFTIDAMNQAICGDYLKIKQILKDIFEDKCKKIYNRNEFLTGYKAPGKIGQKNIHHSWTYYGFFKGWR
jgi:hypothetical protein